MPVDEPLFSTGTKAKIQAMTRNATTGVWEVSGTASDIPNLRSISGNTWTMSFSETTALADTYIRRRPARLDKGTVTFGFTAMNTTPSTNQFTDFKSKLENKGRWRITVDIEGTSQTFDDSTPLISFDGYIQTVSSPAINIDDNVLTYEVGLQLD